MSDQFFISSDAELMWNVLPAIALPSQSKFLTARDRNGNPMVFGIGTDSILRVAQEDPATRHRKLVDLNPKLGLPDTSTTDGFDLFQAHNGDIYLSLAYHENNETRLMAVRAFNPSGVDFTDGTSELQRYRSIRLDSMQVKDLVLGTFVSSTDFPSIIVNYTNTEKRSDNVKRYEVAHDTIENQGDLSLPVNAQAIRGIAVGKIKRHTGVFVLFDEGSARSIMFSSWSTIFNSRVVCPPEAGYILALPNGNGDTDLIAGGDGIWHFASQDMLARDAKASLVCDGSEFQGISDMHIASASSRASIWVTTGDLGISYVEVDISGLNGRQHPPSSTGVPLIPAGDGGGIAGFVGGDGHNAVLVCDKTNQMSYFEQAPDTKMWKRTPFWFPSLEKTVSMQSFMTRIVVHDGDRAPVPLSRVDLASTGWVDVVINGVPVKLGTAPASLETDEEGSLNIINPTNDISSYHFVVTAVQRSRGGPKVDLGPVTINPMEKVEKAMSTVTADTLSTATTADGEPVFQNCSKDEFEQAAAALKEIDSARASLGGESVMQTAGTTESSLVPMHTEGSSGGGILDKIKDVLWDFWEWTVAKVERITAWVVETYNNVKAFVIQIGEQAYRFVLETATQIAKAASFVYTKYLKAPLERIVGWLQNLFSWKDVVETKNTIVDFINATVDYGSSNLDWAANALDAKFDGWMDAVRRDLTPANIPDAVKTKRAGPKAQRDVSAEKQEQMGKADVKQNWTKYQLTHGGALRGSIIEDIEVGVVKQYQDTWNMIIKPFFNSVDSTFQEIRDDIALLFKDKGDLSVEDVLKKVGVSVLLGILDGVKTLLVGVLKRIALLLDDFKTVINKKIKVPIFSDLWVMAAKLFNKDAEPPTFTVIGFIGFVLAIPITFMTKLFTGRKPPAPKFNVKSLSAFFDGSAPASDKLSYNGFSALVETAASSTLAIVGLASIVGLGGALAKVFDFQLLLGVVRVAVCFPTDNTQPLYEVRCAISAVDAVNVFVLAIARKVDQGGQSEKVLAVIEGSTAVLNIILSSVVNGAELVQDWKDKDDERTAYQVLISVLGGAATVGKAVAVVGTDPYTKLAGTVTKQVAGKSSGFFNVLNTYGNVAKGKYTFVLNSGA
ncbi:hypothetical protein QBC43DRAFT_285840 [Cladorrhinum sp. PSN259]|nr:hypothetical protein QBC43DRAFT_285840 [Cladorrhinum sp. PSN259]